MNQSSSAAERVSPEDFYRLGSRMDAAALAARDTYSQHCAALELRDSLMVEAYENGWKLHEIAEHNAVSPARVHAIIART